MRTLEISSEFPQLATDEVHIFCMPLSFDIDEVETWDALLSEDERDKAARFVFEKDRARYITCRGMLRRLLGAYLRIDPSTLRFFYGHFGKPGLSSYVDRRLRFTLSHAGDWVAYAVSEDREVGIDIEKRRDDVSWRELAPLVFSPNERAEFDVIPGPEKADCFLRGWTRKEAYVKARGDGLSCPLDTFDVPLQTLEAGNPVAIREAHGGPSGWTLHPLDLIDGFLSALVVKGPPARISVCGETAWAELTQDPNPALFGEPDSAARSFSTASLGAR